MGRACSTTRERSAYRVLVRIPKRKRPTKDIHINGRII
jgi:hypothetical protein